MTAHARFPNRSARTKRALGIQQALEWAFRTERARLELPEPPDPERDGSPGFGLEYVLMQRAALGCRIDGGRYKPDSSTHEDAEVIAACVANLPTPLGGLRMAIRIAELARAGMTPDWMPGAVPRCVPVEMKRNQHGTRSVTIAVGTLRVQSRGKWRTVELRACPVAWSPHPEQIEAAHRHYVQWWLALDWVRDGLLAGGMLRSIDVTDAMPKREPWA
ncbi:hypothetical protein J7376_16380 [Paracoccus sp. R12_1]|uniref:hypothetical protein n=1 Tax=unclassified Paracoccus (in: a-proteobacteria) TaxID=2688777 RepID=UPI001ADB179F|nr:MULTISPECIES: hypothetical protein [unclassified Paracoccus (in: a-proteobacteria)]MBO9457014.1 hypothetical protein [Paracoccus sp. R12_2]MBO9488101.1 hypothetical protein [Paracoccus sp. R12_1]